MSSGEITAVATIVARPGMEDEFAARFVELGVLARAFGVGGMHEARFLRPTDGSVFVVISIWTSEEAYVAWGRSTAAEELRDLLEPLLKETPATATFTVAQDVRRDK